MLLPNALVSTSSQFASEMSILTVDGDETSNTRSPGLIWLCSQLWLAHGSTIPVRRILRSKDEVAERGSLRGPLVLLSNTPAPLLGCLTSEMSYCCQTHERSENTTGSGRDAARQAWADVDWIWASDVLTSWEDRCGLFSEAYVLWRTTLAH
jgi:hypothetical protein